MPKVRPLGDQWENQFRAEVKFYMALNGIKSNAELAKRMCIPQSTLSRHLKNPAIMSVGELKCMAKVLGMPEQNVGEMIRGKKP